MMSSRALVVLLMLLVAGAPAASADAQPALAESAMVADVGVAAALSLPMRDAAAQPNALAVTVLAQLEQQGLFAPGTLAGALAADDAGPLPPSRMYRDAHAVCDLDGDGVEDMVSNDLALAAPPSFGNADARVQAVSAASGEVLWTISNFAYVPTELEPRVGEPIPKRAENVQPFGDVDGDGVCDLVTFGFDDAEFAAPPIVGTPSLARYESVLRVVSGADGSIVWEQVIEGQRAAVQDTVFRWASVMRYTNIPTGILAFDSPQGPRLVFKTTDYEYAYVAEPLGLLYFINPLGTDVMPRVFKGPFFYESVTAVERVRSFDVATGSIRWERALAPADDSRYTNMTWMSGVADLDGDGELDVVLDQLTITNPRTRETNQPIPGGSTFFRYGRGMRVTALDGTDGQTMWMSVVRETEVAETNPPLAEESYEILAFTHAEPTRDLDGDGVPDVMASYVAVEEQMSATNNGAIRTHLVPISGANGTVLWDVRQQGWGFARVLDGGDGASARHVGVGMLDMPENVPDGARFPPKFVRLLVLDARDGANLWSYERSFSQNSFVSYNLALTQFKTTLAPYDWDKDGILDLVTPSQYSPATGRDQVLLATASHTYEVKSGADGATIATLRAWGPDGRIVACDGASEHLTVISGHARRVDLTRFDPTTGAQVWREPLYNDPAPRAATTGIDMTGIGGTCADTSDGRTRFALNLQAFSFDRRAEVISVRGLLGEEGGAWMEPQLRGEPSTEIMLAGAPDEPQRAWFSWPVFTVGAAIGGVAAVLTLGLMNAGRFGARLLGVSLVLLMLLPALAPAAAFGSATPPAAVDALAPIGMQRDDPPPTRATQPAVPAGGVPLGGPQGALLSGLTKLGDDWTPQAHMEVVHNAMRELGFNAPTRANNTTATGFDENTTISFTYELPDIDGDGREDVLLDQYCSVNCEYPFRFPDDINWYVGRICGAPHQLYALSGDTGQVVWRRALDVVTYATACSHVYTLGTMSLPDGRVGILTYQYTSNQYTVNLVGDVIQHDLRMIDAATGEDMWTFTELGTYATDFASSYKAKSVLLQPLLLQVPAGVTGLDDGVQPTLLVQGIGFEAHHANSWLPTPGMLGINRNVLLVDAYQPDEWAAQIDLLTGEVVWRVETFTPGEGTRSVLPRLARTDWREPYYAEETRGAQYWGAAPCCFDGTGDGVPDLAYRVFEWTMTPNANTQGPYMLASRIVTFDGATGAPVADVFVQENARVGITNPDNDYYTVMSSAGLGFAYAMRITPFSDVNGDGASDMILREEFFDADYRQIFTVRSGRDASLLWEFETPRDLRIVNVGDADSDGASDVLLVDWYQYERGQAFSDEYVAPAETPLQLLSGRTGETLWKTYTYQAPADVVLYYDTLLRNGLPDVDGDGVADVVVDEPQYLGDQTVIHEQRILSGRDARTLYTIRAVGGFAIPARVADVTGDGLDDLVVVSGDVNDMWMTLHRGSDGEALWARRLLAVPASGFAQALPQLKFHALDDAASETGDVAVNMHLDLLRASGVGTYTCIGCEGGEPVESGTSVRYTAALDPQILRLDGRFGSLTWALPLLESHALESAVMGASPGAKAYDTMLAQAEATAIDEARAAIPALVPAAIGFAAAYLLLLGAGVPILRARRRNAEVPDLD